MASKKRHTVEWFVDRINGGYIVECHTTKDGITHSLGSTERTWPVVSALMGMYPPLNFEGLSEDSLTEWWSKSISTARLHSGKKLSGT